VKTFPILLRQNAKYFFRGQEDSPQHRSAGVVVADVSLENAAYYISEGLADLYVGPQPRNVEYLNPNHPLSRHQLYLKRKIQDELIIRAALAAQQPQ
jgi:hypothetical protein